MAGTGQGIPVSGSGSGYTRAELKQYMRFLLSEFDPTKLADEHLLKFDLNQLALLAYTRVARELRAFRASYTLTATPSQAIYALASFSAGAGARLFEIRHAAFDSKELDLTTEHVLDATESDWRFKAAATPRKFLPWGAGKFRLYPAPAAAATIYVEGFETPDPAMFDNDADYPQIHADDQPLIAIYMAMVVAVGAPNEHAMKATPLWNMWTEGLTTAQASINSGGGRIVQGRAATAGTILWPTASDNIVRAN